MIIRNTYEALIVTESQFITKSVAEAIAQMCAAGGNVFFINQPPGGICDESTEQSEKQLLENLNGAEIMTLAQLLNRVEEKQLRDIRLCPENSRIRYIRYQDAGTKYMFVNEGEEPYFGKIHVPEQGFCSAYDAWENKLYEQKRTEDGAGTVLQVEIYPRKSLIVIFGEMPGIIYPPMRMDGVKVDFGSRWTRSLCESVNYPAFGEGKLVEIPDYPDPIRTYMGLEQKVPECASGINGCINIYETKLM